MRAILTVIEGKGAGRTAVVEEGGATVIGRDAQAGLSLKDIDSHMSRSHCVIEIDETRVTLRDLGSQNGTFVNGHRVSRTTLRDGDRINAGKSTIRVALSREDEVLLTRYDSNGPGGADLPIARMAGDATFNAQVETCRACGMKFLRDDAPGSKYLCDYCEDDLASSKQTIPNYRVVRELGRGGMGIVSLAIREGDGACVAIKSVLMTGAIPSKTRVARFVREAGILRDLIHPHIVTLHEIGDAQNQYYFVMEYVDGPDAARLLRSNGPIPIGRAVNLACQLLEALDYAHAKGFIHRDIKPANLLIASRDGRDVLKLSDFGLARALEREELTSPSDHAGTLAFMAPEQFRSLRKASPATDQFGVAATLYNLLTDHYIHEIQGMNVQAMATLLETPAIPIRDRRPEIPDDLAGMIHRALAVETRDRFPSVVEFRRALARFSGDA